MGTEPLLTRQDGNGAAHEPDVEDFDRSAPPAGEESREPSPEESRLDEAMRRADDLLIHSLRDDEARRRGRRRKVAIASAGVGGLIMLLAIIAVLAGLAGNAGEPGNERSAADGGADALAKEGWALWQAGQADEARGKFEAALKFEPNNANTWNGLGWARLHSGEPKEAEEAFARASSCSRITPPPSTDWAT